MISLSPLFLDGRALLDADRILQAGLADRRASFELSINRLPPHNGFAVVSGMETLLSLLTLPLVETADLDELKRIVGFSDALVQRLMRFALRVDIDTVPDGSVVFPRTPLASIEGPFLEAALISAMVRDTVELGTAVATRAARLHIAAGNEPLIDGASVRSSSPSASLAVARAAHVGGASSTTNPVAAAILGIPFRESASLDLGVIAPASTGPDGWGESASDLLVDLAGPGDDEEEVLVEAKRIGARAGGWIARGLSELNPSVFAMRYELVALEEDGAWSPRRGASGDALPGRKRIARYFDASGRAVADVIHLQNERMQSARTVGAATLNPLALTVMRAGKLISVPEAPAAGRERSIIARAALNGMVTQLRRPSQYRVELSASASAMRDSLETKVKPPARA